jgi:NADPH-ferrihemoprotein reductase
MEEKYPAGKMSIYFGSQTGTAMGFAKLLGGIFGKKGFEVKVVDLEDFRPEELLQSRIAIFLVATYGEGNPTDNALRFYEWLCNTDGSLPSTYLSNVSFAVFGLGNSTYVNYNQMGKNCDQMLERLGGKRVHPFACGDDSCTLEEDFETWKMAIAVDFLKKYVSQEKRETTCTRPRVALTFMTQLVFQAEAIIPSPTEINTTTKYFFSSPQVKLSAIRDLRKAGPQRTLHLEFDISKSGLQYNAADNLAIIPENNPADVQSFAARCGGYDLSQYVKLVPTPQDTDVEMPTASAAFRYPFPSPCTIETIFTKYLDIFGIPRRSTLERFGPYVKDQQQFMWLEALIAKENRDDYSKLIENEGKTYASLLAKELSSCVIPLDHLLHLVPFIQPRFYTISSSGSLFPNSIHLTGW